MADKEYNVQVKVTAVSEDAALNQMRTALGNVELKIKEVDQAMKQGATGANVFGQSLNSLRNYVIGFASVGALTAWLKTSAQDFMEEEKAVKALTAMLKQLSPEVTGISEQLKDWSEKFKKLGEDDTLFYQRLQQILPVTKDLTEAVKLHSLTLDIAAATGKDYNAIMEILLGLMAGRQRSLIAAFKEFGIEANTTQDAMNQLFSQFVGYSEKTKGLATDVERYKIAIVDAGKAIIEWTANAYSFWVDGFKKLGRDIEELSLKFYTIVEKYSPFDWLKDKAHQARIEVSEMLKAAKEAEKGFIGPMRPPQVNASNAKNEIEEKELKESLERRWKMEETWEQKVNALGDEMAAHNKRRLENIEKAYKQNADNIIAEVKRRAAEEERINDLLGKNIKQMGLSELANYKAILHTEVILAKQNAALKAAIERQLTEVSKQENKERREAYADYTANILDSLSALFGNNKELAIASTIISTYSAAQKQFDLYAGTPMAYAAAAAAILAGMARVKAIMETKIEKKSARGGYDIPAGIDPVVQTHEKEMILPADLAEGFRNIIRTQSTINNYGGNSHISINALTGAYGAREALKVLMKNQARYNKLRVK